MPDMTDEQIGERLAKVGSLPTCNDWSRGFAESNCEQHANGRVLSEKQRAICHRILTENNKEAQKALANWHTEYNMHHKKKATQLANYYKRQGNGYYGDVVKDILEGKVPDRSKYLRMRNNKYAKKVLVELERKPRFSIEDHIEPNSKFFSGYGFHKSMMQASSSEVYIDARERDNFKKRGGVIIAMDDNIYSAAKGAKRYLVLPFGSANTYWTEERFLKLKKQRKSK